MSKLDALDVIKGSQKKDSKWGLSYNYFQGEEHKLSSISRDLFCFAFVAMHLIVLTTFKGYVSNSTPYTVYYAVYISSYGWRLVPEVSQDTTFPTLSGA